jgi:hypothetical protein
MPFHTDEPGRNLGELFQRGARAASRHAAAAPPTSDMNSRRVIAASSMSVG